MTPGHRFWSLHHCDFTWNLWSLDSDHLQWNDFNSSILNKIKKIRLILIRWTLAAFFLEIKYEMEWLRARMGHSGWRKLCIRNNGKTSLANLDFDHILNKTADSEPQGSGIGGQLSWTRDFLTSIDSWKFFKFLLDNKI